MLSLAEQQFAKNLALGMPQTAAARAASVPASNVKDLMANPEIHQAVAQHRQEIENRVLVSRNDVLQGLLSAVEDAKLQGEVMPQVAAWREIGKIIGAYAPEEKKITYSGDVTVIQRKIRELADEKLQEYALIEGEVVSEELPEEPTELKEQAG